MAGSCLSREKRKGLKFVGRALIDLKALDPVVKQRIGRELLLVQAGGKPETKTRNDLGSGIFQLNVCNESGQNIGRCFYVVKFKDDLYVLHSFIKKARNTPLKEEKKITTRYKQLLGDLQKEKG